MSAAETWQNFFKFEVQSSGAKLFAQEKILLSSTSDTTIHAYVKASPPLTVRMRSAGIDAESFTVACTCPVAAKGRFCKHIWGTLLSVAQNYPDFLSAKTRIEIPEAGSSPESEKKAAFKETAKQRASDYRKEQYQRAKNSKREKQNPVAAFDPTSLPNDVAAAWSYFLSNGFEMPTGPSEEILSEAKRKLSRVFHPDRGGSHDEIVELNQNCEVLLKYLRTLS